MQARPAKEADFTPHRARMAIMNVHRSATKLSSPRSESQKPSSRALRDQKAAWADRKTSKDPRVALTEEHLGKVLPRQVLCGCTGTTWNY